MSEIKYKLIPNEPKREQVYRKVRTAIQQGILVRPAKCQHCGAPNKPGTDGRSTIHAHHHHGYDKPLDVEWLCVKCHHAVTPPQKIYGGGQPPGEKNTQAKLNNAIVLTIRASKEPSRKLAAKYGVDHKTILCARNRELWRHI